MTAIHWAVPSFLCVVACAVLLARPSGSLHRALAAALLLRAGVMGASILQRGALDHRDALAAASSGVWYVALLAFATVCVAVALRPGRGSGLVVGATLVLCVAALGTQVVSPSLFIERVQPGALGYVATSGRLLYLLGAAATASDAFLVLQCARVATQGGTLGRAAAFIGAAHALFLAYAAGTFVVHLFAVPLSPGFLLRATVALAAGAAALWAAPRLARGLGGSVAGAVAAVGVLVVCLGMIDAQVALGRIQLGSYAGALDLLRLLFGVSLAIGALRFGAADVGRRARRSLETGIRVSLAALALVGVFIAVRAYAGASTIATFAAVIVGVAVVPATWRLLAQPSQGIARRVLLPEDDPRAAAERARTYAAAVAAARDAGTDGARYLAELRDDLGVTEREHELLVHGLASRETSRYRAVETLGRGATAQVELAVDEVAGKRVVLKRFTGLRDPAAALREARALAAVRHPRVVPFLEVDRRDDALHLVLAYAEGGSARQLLDREGPLPTMRAVGLTADLLEGLEALHAAGIVHCDVKPENLLLDADGRGMLGDFGSAKFAAPDVVDATLAGEGAEGSLSTISPEALRRAPPAPARDVYAAGATLYRLLTGEHHVDLRDATVFEARERITMDPPRLPHPRVPPAVETVLRTALAKRPEDRFRSAREMREALLRASARQSA